MNEIEGGSTVELVPYSPAPLARRDDTLLPGTAGRIQSGVPENTRKSYRKVRADFEEWCTANGRTPYPTSATTLADYTAHLCDLGLAPSTVRHRRNVVSALNQAEGFPPLGKEITYAARLAQRGYQRDRAEEGHREDKAPPITRARLIRLASACDDRTLTGLRDHFLLVLGWSFAARRSELAGLRMTDIRRGDDHLEVLIRTSKTDKESAGVIRKIPHAEHTNIDSIILYDQWIAALDALGEDTSTGPLFRGVTKTDKPYKLKKTRRRVKVGDDEWREITVAYGGISGDTVDNIVKKVARRAMLPNPGSFSAHSLRAGYATQAAEDGIPFAIWAEFGRWDINSPVAQGYVRIAEADKQNPLRKMLR